ncbi:MAG: mechanosensitive ion channel domain-containing protein [Bacteroidota bacterium]
MNSLGEEVNKLFNQIASGFLDLVPKLLLALVILLSGFIVAKFAQRFTKRFILYLHRTINDQLNRRSLKIDLKGSASFISKTLFWLLILFFAGITIQILEFSMVSRWIDGLILYLPNFLGAVIIVFVGIIAGRFSKDLVVSASVLREVSAGENIGNLARYAILIISVIIAIDQVGIDILFLTNLVDIIIAALLFGAALAFGLGAKTSVSNILGSYYMQKKYEEGDTIQVDGIEGVIINISPTAVFLDTKSGQVSIPAKDFSEQKTTLIKKSR